MPAPGTIVVGMESTTFEVRTGHDPAVVDVTSEIAGFCSGKGDGLLSVFVPHATAGVAIFETGAGSDTDVMTALDELLPADPSKWRHEHGSPGHGRDHVLPAFVSPSVTVPVIDGHPQLGTWQSVVLIDTNVDNPVRKLHLSFISG
jgi:secondary thiamine-phosphate synthase enzyme